MAKLTTDEFIKRSRRVHGDKYDYSLAEYRGVKSKVKIICPEHGIFEQAAKNHYEGKNCPECEKITRRNSIVGKKTLGTDVFIKRSRSVHGDKYDYSLVEYRDISSKVKIICPEHGIFEQAPDGHMSGRGCFECSKIQRGLKKRLSFEEFVSRARAKHGDRYEYDKSSYRNLTSKVKIKCPVHGTFEQVARDHLHGGCRACAAVTRGVKRRLNVNDFVSRAVAVHGDKYDYSHVKYVSNATPVKIICKDHGEFHQVPHVHFRGNGCRKCTSAGVSAGEKELTDYVKSVYTSEILENYRGLIRPHEVDIYIPDKKLAIEYNGLFWHSEASKDKNYHKMKYDLCKEKGVQLIQIWESDWISSRNAVETMLKHKLGVSDSKRVYARHCAVTEDISRKEAREILTRYHIQGATNHAEKYVALKYGKNIVALIAYKLGAKNTSHSGKIILTRYVTNDTVVVGGLGKLTKYLKRKFNKNVISYVDLCVSNGDSYFKVGYKEIKRLPPDYKYVRGAPVLIHKFNFRKDVIVKKYLPDLDPNDYTERELCEMIGAYRVYDCGKLVVEF